MAIWVEKRQEHPDSYLATQKHKSEREREERTG